MMIKIQQYANDLGIPVKLIYKQLIGTSVMTALLSMVVYYVTQSYLSSVATLILGLVVMITSITSMKKRAQLLKTQELGALLSFFDMLKVKLLMKTSLSIALQELRSLCDQKIIPVLAALSSDIEVDPSYEPYLKFSDSFRNEQVALLMQCIYEINNKGMTYELINQYQSILYQLHTTTILRSIKTSREHTDWVALLPIIAIVVFAFFFATGILSLVVNALYE